ncbi:ABC transporter permease [Acuticoccus sp. I52.16.1]|uniref:ABC transporter permease n=1 Tax=Acuticoccus sp. I52.16.1 TaxID=2928472 RepID=UPI001FD5483D|nr:ABC transporter permease [Acuticoccus sp. I52.16.1]UOM35385.1 ABC transporter permease [Acuticoccus sp. I52.16.1]
MTTDPTTSDVSDFDLELEDDGDTRASAARENAAPWVIAGATLIVWQLACWVFDIKRFVLPAPTDIAASLWKWKEVILIHAGQTLYTTILGFFFAVLGGLALGVAVGYSRMLYKALYPILIAFNSVPKVAIVPVLVIWFGIGTIPAVITAFMLSFFPIAVNVAAGLATVEPELEDVLRSLGATRRTILFKVGLPRSMPYFFASLKVAITLALVGSVISETIASNAGIGYLMLNASSRFDVPLVFAGLFVVAVMGVAIYTAFAAVETRTTGWATRGQTARFDAGGG